MDLILSLIFIIGAVIIVILDCLRSIGKKWLWAYRFPGPRFELKTAISGNMVEVSREKMNFGKRMIEKFGRIYRIRVGCNPVIVLADPMFCQQLYHGTNVHSHPEALGLGCFFKRHHGNAIGCLNGQDWTR